MSVSSENPHFYVVHHSIRTLGLLRSMWNFSGISTVLVFCVLAEAQNQSTGSTWTNLVVHDPKTMYIRLNRSTTETKLDFDHESRFIQWVVQIDAYPKPEITWLDPLGRKITDLSSASGDDKYVIINTEVSTSLKINNLKVEDSGNYALKAEISETKMVETMDFTLNVLAKPVAIVLENSHKNYVPGEIAVFSCTATGNPNPEITWSLWELGSSTLQILNSTEEHQEGTSRTSTVRFQVQTTGHIICSAGNELGIDIVEREILVTAKTNYFVGNETMISIQGEENSTVEIPCRPTSRDYEVQLMTDNDKVIEKGENVVFYSTQGFTIKKVALSDGGIIKCVINGSDGIQEKKFNLTVIRQEKLMKPVIIEEPLRHVNEGERLRVNCTVNVKENTSYLLKWTTPKQDSRITSKLYKLTRKGFFGNSETVSNELQIDDVNKDDVGEYTCTVHTLLCSESTSMKLMVQYINLTTEKKIYSEHESRFIEWVVQIDAYPHPEITWLDPLGRKIKDLLSASEDDKYVIINTEVSTSLKINNLKVEDSGNYVLKAENLETKMVETMNFTLKVLPIPVAVILGNSHKNYMPGEIAEFSCNAIGNPNPQITWRFRGLGSSTLQILNSTEEYLGGKSRNSTVRFQVQSPGNITCFAENELGINIVEREIRVTAEYGPLESPYCGIVEKEDAERGMYPWLVQLGEPLRENEVNWDTFGSLISARHVLTSADKCDWSENSRPFLVRIGDVPDRHWVGDEGTSIEVRIEKISLHPEWVRGSREHDIAVIRLEKDVVFTRFIRPLCLPTLPGVSAANLVGDELPFATWGQYHGYQPVAPRTVELIKEGSCWVGFYRHHRRTESPYDELCTSCLGRGISKDYYRSKTIGSPLMYVHAGAYYSIVMMTRRSMCIHGPCFDCEYVKTSTYLEWIKSELK